MGQFKSKADKAFEEKLTNLLPSQSYLYDLGQDWEFFGDEFEIPVTQRVAEWFDFEHVQHLFMCYGFYLELIDPEVDMTTADVKERLKL